MGGEESAAEPTFKLVPAPSWPAYSKVEVESGATLYVGANGERWLTRRGKAEAAVTLWPADLLAVSQAPSGELRFIDATGQALRAAGPLTALTPIAANGSQQNGATTPTPVTKDKHLHNPPRPLAGALIGTDTFYLWNMGRSRRLVRHDARGDILAQREIDIACLRGTLGTAGERLTLVCRERTEVTLHVFDLELQPIGETTLPGQGALVHKLVGGAGGLIFVPSQCWESCVGPWTWSPTSGEPPRLAMYDAYESFVFARDARTGTIYGAGLHQGSRRIELWSWTQQGTSRKRLAVWRPTLPVQRDMIPTLSASAGEAGVTVVLGWPDEPAPMLGTLTFDDSSDMLGLSASLPFHSALDFSGSRGMAHDRHRWFETADGGRHWEVVPGPYIPAGASDIRCFERGCWLPKRGFRLGWRM